MILCILKFLTTELENTSEKADHIHTWERLVVKRWDKPFTLMLKSYGMTAGADMEKNVCARVMCR